LAGFHEKTNVEAYAGGKGAIKPRLASLDDAPGRRRGGFNFKRFLAMRMKDFQSSRRASGSNPGKTKTYQDGEV